MAAHDAPKPSAVRIVRLAATALVLALADEAAAQPAGAGGDALVKALADCRLVSDDRARLACYDAAGARLSEAQTTGEVVIVDRATVRAARRQAFGFSLPSLDVFGRGEREPQLDRVQAALSGASQGANGRWILRTVDGQVWRQTDDNRLYRAPNRGSRVDIRKAALGSFFMNIDNQKAIRVRREQ